MSITPCKLSAILPIAGAFDSPLNFCTFEIITFNALIKDSFFCILLISSSVKSNPNKAEYNFESWLRFSKSYDSINSITVSVYGIVFPICSINDSVAIEKSSIWLLIAFKNLLIRDLIIFLCSRRRDVNF